MRVLTLLAQRLGARLSCIAKPIRRHIYWKKESAKVLLGGKYFSHMLCSHLKSQFTSDMCDLAPLQQCAALIDHPLTR